MYLIVQGQLSVASLLASGIEHTCLQSGPCGLQIKNSIMLDFHLRDARFRRKTSNLVPVHPAGNVDVIHEALDVQRQIGRVGTHQLLQFLALLVQPQQSPWVVPHIKLVLALELLAEVIYQHLVKVAPTEVRVKRSGEDLTQTGH